MRLRSHWIEEPEPIADRAEALEVFTVRYELRFLAPTAAHPTTEGVILEIGSFKGRPTVRLALSSQKADQAPVHACDLREPHGDLPQGSCELDFEQVHRDFLSGLQSAGLRDQVVVQRIFSKQLGAEWPEGRKVRLLFIGADHTHAVWHADLHMSLPYDDHTSRLARLDLYAMPARLVPYRVGSPPGYLTRMKNKVLRALVPHAPPEPAAWLQQVSRPLPDLHVP